MSPYRVIAGPRRPEESETKFCGVDLRGFSVATLRARLVLASVAAAAIASFAAFSAAPAKALLGINLGLGGSNCSTAGSQVFLPFDGDTRSYYLAPNGGFENGSTGWSLNGGASVVWGNHPFLSSGSHALSLPSGSTATGPAVCIGPNDVAVRLFASDQGGTDNGLRLRVVWYGLLNTVLGLTDVTVYAPGGPWAPGDQLDSSGGGNILIPLLGSTSARIQATPLGTGSNWRIDDLYIDPWVAR